MADSNTCEQCGTTNKPVRQSKRGKLFCFPCWENENPQEALKELNQGNQVVVDSTVDADFKKPVETPMDKLRKKKNFI